MTREEILTLVVTSLCVISLSIVFTLFYVHYYKNSKKAINQGQKDIEIIDDNIDEQLKAKSKKHKIYVLIIKIISYTFSFLVFGLFVLSVINRVNDGRITVGDSTLMVVETGSMSYKNEANLSYLSNIDNQIQTFDIIGVSRVEHNEIKLYDVIAFKNDSNQTIIHRIIKIENGIYTTRGDANESSDPWVITYEDIIGVYNGFNIPLCGVFIIFLQSNSGIVTVIAIMYCLILFGVLQDKIEKLIENRKKELLQVIEIDLSNTQFSSEFIQKIYYRGYVYSFNNNTFLSKEKIEENDEYTPQDKGDVIKVIKSDDDIKVETDHIAHEKQEEKQ